MQTYRRIDIAYNNAGLMPMSDSALQAPDHVDVAELFIMPTEQVW